METKELFGIGRTFITAWGAMLLATGLMAFGKIDVDMWSIFMYSGMGLAGSNKIAETIGKKKG